MKLLWCAYTKGSKTSKRLYLDLGRDNKKLYALATASLGKEEIAKIRRHAGMLDKLDTKSIVQWITKECPKAMQAFRSPSLSGLRILTSYDVKP